MRKVFLDDLPRWGKGGKGKEGTINWSECVGMKVKFIYDTLEGEIKIVDYSKENRNLIVSYLNKEYSIKNGDFKNCKIGNIIGIKSQHFKIEVGATLKSDKRELTILDRERRSDGKYYKYKCNKCGYIGYKIEYSMLDGSSCPCCTNQIVVEGINDIATTNPELVKYFKGGHDEAKLYTRNSRQKVDVICFECQKSRLISVFKIKENLVCKSCKGKTISKIKNICDVENSFAMNDKYDRLKYWDYSKNNESPYEVHKGSMKKFWFTCENDHSFKSALSTINGQKPRWCIHCSSLLLESKMASTLKQVLKHEFPNTIWEYDMGFKGEKGGVSHYDIYVPELNLIIECQSEYHDNKKDFDLMKKEFAISNGYEYMEIDYRDFNILDVLKMFFPYVYEIPKYVKYSKLTTCNWDLEKAQELIDMTDLSQKQVCDLMGVKITDFCDKVRRGKIIIPKNKRMRKTPVVQLDLDGNFIRRHDKAIEFKRYGFNTPDICHCCKGKLKSHKGFMFIYEKDYQNSI